MKKFSIDGRPMIHAVRLCDATARDLTMMTDDAYMQLAHRAARVARLHKLGADGYMDLLNDTAICGYASKPDRYTYIDSWQHLIDRYDMEG